MGHQKAHRAPADSAAQSRLPLPHHPQGAVGSFYYSRLTLKPTLNVHSVPAINSLQVQGSW